MLAVQEMLDRRDVLLEQLRQRGVLVLEMEPERTDGTADRPVPDGEGTEFDLRPDRQAAGRDPPPAGEVEHEEHQQRYGNRELDRGRGAGRRDETLDQAGDDEQREHAEQQADGVRSGLRDRVPARQRTGEQDPLAKQQAGAAGDEDGGELEHAVRRDEAPEREAHAGAGAGARR